MAASMRAPREINLRREIATALAVLTMLLQVAFAPILIEHHAYSVETDYGLTVICGSTEHPLDPSTSGDPATAPAHDHQSHDCPCCLGAGGHATLPEPAIIPTATRVLHQALETEWTDAQVAKVVTLSDQQLPRAPPALG